MRRVGIFAGTQPGYYLECQAAVERLAQELVAHQIGVVYGGGSGGLMGVLARSVLEAGGEVIGVIPRGLWHESENQPYLTLRLEVSGLGQRKEVMASLADAFLAVPGGIETFDEILTMLTTRQFGLSDKPLGLLNLLDYFNPLLALLERAQEWGFLVPSVQPLWYSADESAPLLAQLIHHSQTSAPAEASLG